MIRLKERKFVHDWAVFGYISRQRNPKYLWYHIRLQPSNERCPAGGIVSSLVVEKQAIHLEKSKAKDVKVIREGETKK